MEQHRIPVQDCNIILGEYSELSGYQCGKKLLELTDFPTAGIFASDPIAIGCIRYLQEHGLNLPRDFASIGFGDISQALADMLRGFHCRVLAYDIRQNQEAADRLGVTFCSLDELIAASDVISLHLPLTPATKHMVNEEFLGKMKEGAVLVNTSRGALIDEVAVTNALKDGRLGAFGTDVFATEPPPADSPILSAPRTMLLPHSGSNGIESVEYAGEYAARNVIDFFSGKEVKTILNPTYAEHKRV